MNTKLAAAFQAADAAAKHARRAANDVWSLANAAPSGEASDLIAEATRLDAIAEAAEAQAEAAADAFLQAGGVLA